MAVVPEPAVDMLGLFLRTVSFHGGGGGGGGGRQIDRQTETDRKRDRWQRRRKKGEINLVT